VVRRREAETAIWLKIKKTISLTKGEKIKGIRTVVEEVK